MCCQVIFGPREWHKAMFHEDSEDRQYSDKPQKWMEGCMDGVCFGNVRFYPSPDPQLVSRWLLLPP